VSGLGAFIEPSEVDLLLRATVLVCIAWLGALALRRAKAAAASRHLMWLSVVAGLLLLPLLSAWLPDVHIPLLPPPALQADATALVPTVEEPWWGWALRFFYGAVATILLMRLVHASWKLRKLWGASRVADDSWISLVEECRRVVGLRRRIALRLTQEPLTPMTWGMLAPKVLLPASAEGWPTERRRMVLMHELAHVVRHDALTQSVASLAGTLYWFHPVVRLGTQQMRAAQEQAADDLVLRAGAQPVAYARCLVDLAQIPCPGGPTLHAAAAGGASQLETRVWAILHNQALPGRRGSATIVGAAGLLSTWLVSSAVPVKAIQPMQSAARPERAGALSTPSANEQERGFLGPPSAARVRSFTAIGSAPPEATAPTARPDRAPRSRELGWGDGGRSSSFHPSRPRNLQGEGYQAGSYPELSRWTPLAASPDLSDGPAPVGPSGRANALRSREGDSAGALSPAGVPRPPAFAPGAHRRPLGETP
jgi:hypothetical protein